MYTHQNQTHISSWFLKFPTQSRNSHSLHTHCGAFPRTTCEQRINLCIPHTHIKYPNHFCKIPKITKIEDKTKDKPKSPKSLKSSLINKIPKSLLQIFGHTVNSMNKRPAPPQSNNKIPKSFTKIKAFSFLLPNLP